MKLRLQNYSRREDLAFQMLVTSWNSILDIVISNQVAEHVHNVGNYLSQINRVLKKNGKLIISIPNVASPRYFLPPLSKKFISYLKRRSEDVFEAYDKPNTHINSWDAYHFTTLLASCGFKLENLVYCENVATNNLVVLVCVILENQLNI